MRLSYRVDAEAQKRFSKPMRTGSLIAMILGISLLLVFIVLYVLSGDVLSLQPILLGVFLVCGAVLFVVGLIFFLACRMNVKNAAQIDALNEYEFYDDFMTVSTTRRGENIGTVKVYYPDLYRRTERKNEILLYPAAASVYIVPKEGLGENELARLRAALGL